MSTYTEDHLVEQPAIQLMRDELGWEVVNCYDEWSGGARWEAGGGSYWPAEAGAPAAES